MASFESKAVKQSSTALQEMQKFSLRRLEISINKFIKVITIDIDRLQQHRLNVEKFNRLNDWSALNRENVNATRTVQQIKANIKEIKKLRTQVMDEDIEEFDTKTDPMVQQAIHTLQDFVNLRTEISQSNTVTDDTDVFSGRQRTVSENELLIVETEQLHHIPDSSQAEESWENLHENLVELNSLIHDFSSAVKTQQETVDRIEDNIEKAHEGVQKGAIQLGKASKYKAAIFPVAGALLGTVVAGPVGLIAGAKIGGVVGVGIGGTAGFFGGRLLKNRQNQVTEVELKNMSVKKSSSLPDIASESGQKKGWLPWT
ncbi:syntaxin-17-like isoform X2 [Saccostrea echinata]|uniref:syntaxin-17-like isoform X2 n=1 Tax=Saccostrea echinata TaxID=191078 RepID=UPI002A8144C4|nr:syntaxin-17-like isoform X2 [Saccostrea echinata]